MKKILFLIIGLCLIATQGWATTWFSVATADFLHDGGAGVSDVWCDAPVASCTDHNWLTLASIANNDLFVANGNTIPITTDIGSAIVTVTLTTEGTNYSNGGHAGTDGGGFTMDIGTNTGKTLYTNITAGTTACLALTDAADDNNGTLTIVGTITGGTSTSAFGISDGRADADSVLTITGNLQGGAGAVAHGLSKGTHNGQIAISGSSTGGAGGYGLNNTVNAIITVGGDCIAASGTGVGVGCYGAAATGASLTISGTIKSGLHASGASGKYSWTPADNTKYFQVHKSGTDYYYMTRNPDPAVADVKATVTYGWDGSAVYTGTYSSSGGGGAWGF
jgi:hypothetical protein